MCPLKTQISLGFHPVWSESSLCALCIAKDPKLLQADSKDWSDWVDAQADLSTCICWAHRSFCWFCHTQAQKEILWRGHHCMNIGGVTLKGLDWILMCLGQSLNWLVILSKKKRKKTKQFIKKLMIFDFVKFCNNLSTAKEGKALLVESEPTHVRRKSNPLETELKAVSELNTATLWSKDHSQSAKSSPQKQVRDLKRLRAHSDTSLNMVGYLWVGCSLKHIFLYHSL